MTVRIGRLPSPAAEAKISAASACPNPASNPARESRSSSTSLARGSFWKIKVRSASPAVRR